MSQKTFHYQNEDITITWQPEICIHSAICFKGLGKVFDPRRKPWIDMQQSSTETIIEQVNKCPSGALTYATNNKSMIEKNLPEVTQPVAIPTIECVKNGPFIINGAVTIKLPDGTEELRPNKTSLCRCGASKKKPYCDGTHKSIPFEG